MQTRRPWTEQKCSDPPGTSEKNRQQNTPNCHCKCDLFAYLSWTSFHFSVWIITESHAGIMNVAFQHKTMSLLCIGTPTNNMFSVCFTPDGALLWCGCAPSVLRPAIHAGCVLTLEPQGWLYSCSFLSVQNRSSPITTELWGSKVQRKRWNCETFWTKLFFPQTQNPLRIAPCQAVCGRGSPSVHRHLVFQS